MPDKPVTEQTVDVRGMLYAKNEIKRIMAASEGRSWSRADVMTYFEEIIATAFKVGAACGMDEQTRSMNRRYRLKPRGAE